VSEPTIRAYTPEFPARIYYWRGNFGFATPHRNYADGITNVCLSEASLCRHIGTRTGHDAWKVEIPKGTTVFISGVTCGVTRGVNQYKAARAECDDCACARRMAESRGAGA
jgi:hypothetical protein